MPIACGRCGQQGWLLWRDGGRGRECELLDISGTFYERFPRNRLFKATETVCGRCGAVHED